MAPRKGYTCVPQLKPRRATTRVTRCTSYLAVYVFDLDNPILQHGKDFWHLLEKETDLLPTGNVRAITYLKKWEHKIVVAPPEDSCGDNSRGFMADTMEQAVLKLKDAL